MVQHRTVLIVEDSEADRYVFRRYLQTDSDITYNILESTSAAEALALCRTQLPDGILLDVKLPDADGFEFLTRLKAQTEGTCPPVVVVSCYDDARTAATAFKSGVEDYFVKGKIQPAQVRSAMKSAIENAELRSRLQAVEIERDDLFTQAEVARSNAEAANRSKDDFLTMVAHELRAPLNSVLGWAKVLQGKSPDPATLLRALQSIERSAKNQLQLIEDLLDISRMVQGNLRIDRVPLNLAFVIETAIEVIRPLADAKQIAIDTQIDRATDQVLGDANRLQQVVWNLLTNAIKFTPERGQITIALTYTASEAEIRVTDTGKGIDAHFLPLVFDRFRQAHTESPSAQDGLGLGLAITRELVELHEGTIAAISAGKGQGATFTVRLPLIDLPTQSQALGLDQLTILIVDDDPDGLELLRFFLDEQGAIVKTASSANQAIAQFQTVRPDLLISDIAMPEKDGYQLMQEIRSLTPNQPLAAIALTALVDEDVKQQAFAAGYRLHLPKPLDMNQLLAAIATLTQV